MADTVKDVPAKGSMGDLDGGEIDILEMMGRASGTYTYHWQFFVILNAAVGGSRTWASSPTDSTAQHSKRSSRPDPPQDRIRVRSSSRAAATGSTAREGRLMARRSLSSRSVAAWLLSLRELSWTTIANAQRLAARAGAKAGDCPGRGRRAET